MKYVALLRGINVGGNKKVPMAELKALLEKHGFENVRTLLNSGNVIFDSKDKLVVKQIEEILKKGFGFEIPTILNTADQIKDLVKANPFKGEKVAKEIRFYVTFIAEKPASLEIPKTREGFKILRITETEICTVLDLSSKNRTVDMMSILEHDYGKKVTTRNWNTVIKLYDILSIG